MCSRPAVSTSTRSALAARGRGHRVEHDRTGIGAFLAARRSRRRCARPTARAGRRRRRGTCRPPRARRACRRATCCDASLPIVVVFPTPLTPTNIHTFGSPPPACSVRSASRRRAARRPRRATSADRHRSGSVAASSFARCAPRRAAAWSSSCRRRRGAAPLRARPTSRRRSCARACGRTRRRTRSACARAGRADVGFSMTSGSTTSGAAAPDRRRPVLGWRFELSFEQLLELFDRRGRDRRPARPRPRRRGGRIQRRFARNGRMLLASAATHEHERRRRSAR